MAGMKTGIESNTGTQLWGIYYRDREFARVKGDPFANRHFRANEGES